MALRFVLLAAVVVVGVCSYELNAPHYPSYPNHYYLNGNPDAYNPYMEARYGLANPEVDDEAYPDDQAAPEQGDRQERKLLLIKLAALAGLKGLKLAPLAAPIVAGAGLKGAGLSGLGLKGAGVAGLGGIGLVGGAGIGLSGGAVNNNNNNNNVFLSQPAVQNQGITGGTLVFNLPKPSGIFNGPGFIVSGDALNNFAGNLNNLNQNLVSLGPNAAAVTNNVQFNAGGGGGGGGIPSGALFLNAGRRAGEAAEQEVAADAAQQEVAADPTQPKVASAQVQPAVAADAQQQADQVVYYYNPVSHYPQYYPQYYPAHFPYLFQ